MKTLKELGLEQHKTASFADYSIQRGSGSRDLICCSWMDLHDDADNLGPDNCKWFVIMPVYWYPRAVFVYQAKRNGNFYAFTLAEFQSGKQMPGIEYVDKGFAFNATLKHGLVPKDIASRLVADKVYAKSIEYMDWAQKCTTYRSPKLVWKFGYLSK